MLPPKQVDGSANNLLTFQPGGVRGSGQYTTFAELHAAFLLTKGLVFIGIDASVAAASSDVLVYDWQNRVMFGSIGDNFSDVFGSQLTIPNGAQFRNVLRLTQNLQFNTQGSILPSLAWDGPDANFVADGESAFFHTGTLPAMEVGVGQSLFASALGNVNLNNFSGGAGAMFGFADNTGTLLFRSFLETSFFTQNLVSGPAGAQLFYLTDASWPGNPTNPGFAGSTTSFIADNAAQVEYTPAVPGNWNPVPKFTAPALDQLAAKPSGPSPQAGEQVYVNKGGSDVTGNGSVTNPFLTIAHAIAVINAFADAATTKRYDILVGTGEYADTIVLPAWVWIVGNGDVLATRLDGNVSIDPVTWSVPGPTDDDRGGISNAILRGGVTIDFNAANSNFGKFYFNNCWFNNAPLFNEYIGPGASGINQVSIQNCFLFAGYTQNGINMTLTNAGFINGGTIFINSVNNGSNAPAILTALGGGMDTVSPNVAIHAVWTVGAPPSSNQIQIKLSSFGVGGPIILDGAEVSYEATVDGIPPSAQVTLLNGAPAPVNLSADASQITYTPAVPGNWGPVPTEVAQALDELAVTAGSNVFVYQEGGTPGRNRFTTFDGAYLAAAAVRNTRPTFAIDRTFGNPVVLAGGPYVLDGFIFDTFNSTTGGYTTLTWNDGAIIECSTIFVVRGGLTFISLATSAPNWTTVAGQFPQMILEETAFLENAAPASQPFMFVPNGGFAQVLADTQTFLNAGGSITPLFEAVGTGNLQVYLAPSCAMGSDTLTGAGKIQVFYDPSTAASGQISSSQPGATNLEWVSGPAFSQTGIVADAPAGGTIGPIDQVGQVVINQTTPDQNRTIPPPVFTVAGQQLLTTSPATAVPFTIGDATLLQAITVLPDTAVLWTWNGLAWIPPVSVVVATNSAQLAAGALPNPVWATQTEWAVNATTGNDTNVGSLVSPLQTLTEYAKRVIAIGGHRAAAQVVVDILTSTLPTDMPQGTINVYRSPVLVSAVATLIFRGTSGVTTVQSGTFSASTPVTPSTNTYQTGTDSLARPWTPFISNSPTGLRVRNTTAGVRLNSTFWPWKNLVAGDGQFSQPYAAIVLSAGAFGQAMSTLVTGDTYAVEQLPMLDGGWGLSFNVDSAYGAFNLPEAIQFIDIGMSDAADNFFPSLGANAYYALAFFNCDMGFMRVQAQAYSLVNCRRCLILEADVSAEPLQGVIEYIAAGLTSRMLRITNGNGLIWQRHACDTLIVTGEGSLDIEGIQCDVGGVELGPPGGSVRFEALLVAQEVFGICTTTWGVFVAEGTLPTYSSATGLTIVGTVNNLAFGKAVLAKSFAQLPFIASDIAAGSGTTFSGMVQQ